MTDTTDIAAQEKGLRAACEAAADCGYVHNISVDGRTIEWILDQLEAERQRADENQTGSNTFKSIIGYIKDAQRNETFGLWKETSDRLNAGGCNGTANHVIEYLEELNKVFESEAELAALKGDQVPFAWVRVSQNGARNYTSFYPRPRKGNGDAIPLFTAPQKPVVLPSLTIGEVIHRSGFDREYAEGWVSANDNAIREIKAAGGIVKDGE